MIFIRMGQSYYCYTERAKGRFAQEAAVLLTCSDGLGSQEDCMKRARVKGRGQRAKGRGQAELWRALKVK